MGNNNTTIDYKKYTSIHKERKGYCGKSDCKYSHSTKELLSHNPKYRTKVCKNGNFNLKY